MEWLEICVGRSFKNVKATNEKREDTIPTTMKLILQLKRPESVTMMRGMKLLLKFMVNDMKDQILPISVGSYHRFTRTAMGAQPQPKW